MFEIARQLGGKVVRQGVPRRARERIVVSVVSPLPTLGRRKYKGKAVTYTVAGEGPLNTTVKTKEYSFYNLLEGSGGTPFLRVGDEVEIWLKDGLYICLEVPRGFV